MGKIQEYFNSIISWFQAILAVSESVWKRVLDQMLEWILGGGSLVALALGLTIQPKTGEFQVGILMVQVFVSLIVIFIGTGEIPRDVATKNIQFFLSKPLGREGYLAGKFLGVFILGSLILFVYVGFFEVGAAIHGHWDLRQAMIDFVRMTLQMAVLSALLVSVSAILPEVSSTFFGMGAYLASFLAFLLPPMAKILAPEWLHPPFLLVYYLVPNNLHYLWNLEGYHITQFLSFLGIYSIAYCFFVLVIASIWFQNRDLN